MNKAIPFVLAVDVGTSTLKSVLYSRDGHTLAVASGRYEYRSPHAGWAEADPEDWWAAFVSSVQQLRAEGYTLDSLSYIAVTGQMHTVVLLDDDGTVIPPTILWLDRRAAAETAELQDKLELPSHQLNSTYSLPRLLWLTRNQPQVINQVRHILWPKDYLRYRLTGVVMTDRTEAGGAALLDWETLEWAEERLVDLGLDSNVLPPFGEPAESGGPLRADIAGQLGLSEQVQVLVGVGDVLALVTAAPPTPGRVTCSLGSSSMIFYPMIGSEDYSDEKRRIYEYPLLPYRMLGGVSSTSGASLYWAYQTLYGAEQPYDAAIQEALDTAPGADGLVFMPFLSGERSPFWSDALSGGFYGLRLSHSRPQMMRSVMEGVAFSLRYILDIYRELGVPLDQIALAGGGAATPGWPQIFADVCQVPLAMYAGQETVSHGLYAYACLASGETSFADALARTFAPPVYVSPKLECQDDYDRSYKQYCALVEFASQTLAAKH
jgi:xylulokinase